MIEKEPSGRRTENVTLHIERLILDGIDVAPDRRPLLLAEVETELARLLTEGGLAHQLSGGVALPQIGSPAIRLGNAGGPTELGRQIAGAVYEGIGK